MQNFLKGKRVGRASCSKPSRAADDISIYSGLPKTTTRNPKWPEDHNVILGELLLEQYVNGSFCNGNMRKEHWASLVAVLNRRLGSNYTDSSVMIRFKNMKADFRTLYQLTNRSGWGWDEELHIPVATDELWDQIRWEGSAADMRVLRWAVEQGQFGVPNNHYYLVDSGYANTDKFIAPFRGYRYHLAERGSTTRRYTNQQELFNHRHAQLRNVVERTLGIWKERFQVLTHMRKFPVTVQADLVIACAVLHNYIGRYHEHDMYFNMSQIEMEHDSERDNVEMLDEDPNYHTTIGERIQGESIRHVIATDMWNARVQEWKVKTLRKALIKKRKPLISKKGGKQTGYAEKSRQANKYISRKQNHLKADI
ncbi:hypothetical protein M5K25_023315 [Dendrobium thyrsiflorum]|uniref:Myb/SANT-like domain-containing protein n=1 Tax=Dendrobium thyrsiflorum TaxID=117978 RepID=A0ABD0U7S1_DENTH